MRPVSALLSSVGRSLVTEAFVGIGSNTEPERFLSAGIRMLRERFGSLELSPVYRNSAVGFDGDDFFNLVAGFSSAREPLDLTADLRMIEDRCRRDRSLPRYAPRTLDLDLLLYGDAIFSIDGLKLPRPEVLKRSYILKPMADLRPDMLHPVGKLSFAELWQRFDAASHPLHRVDLVL